MKFSTKRKILGFTSALLAGACLAAPALAGKVIPKPAPHGSDPALNATEYSTSLARSGNYTLVGTLQEHVKIPGEAVPMWPSIKQGAVYLMNGTSTTPERLYQFPGVVNFDIQAGSQVAISSTSLAFGTGKAAGITTGSQFENSVFVVRKVNGSWGECGWVNNQRDCTVSVRQNGEASNKPLTRIPLTYPGHFKDIALAISGDTLAIGYWRQSVVEIYRYNSGTNTWNLEETIDEDNAQQTGIALAFDGEKLAVGAPGMQERGVVRIFTRYAPTGNWNAWTSFHGYFASGSFGKSLAMASGRLAVASGAAGTKHVTFFDVDAGGVLSNRQTFQTPTELVHLAISSDTFAATTSAGDEGLVIYKRAASGSWGYETGLIRDYYKSANSNQFGYGGIDPIGISGDELSLGWRAHGINPILRGAVIAEKVSLIDSCRDPLNLVQNCSFDNGSNTQIDAYPSGSYWQLLNWNGGSAWTDFNGRQMRINVQSPGSDMWHVQARTTVNVAQSGTYRLSFRAKADNYRSFVVNLGRNGNGDNNWASYGRITASAGPDWVVYSYDLSGVPADAAALLDFNVGNAGTGGITFDSVKLVRVP